MFMHGLLKKSQQKKFLPKISRIKKQKKIFLIQKIKNMKLFIMLLHFQTSFVNNN